MIVEEGEGFLRTSNARHRGSAEGSVPEGSGLETNGDIQGTGRCHLKGHGDKDPQRCELQVACTGDGDRKLWKLVRRGF